MPDLQPQATQRNRIKLLILALEAKGGGGISGIVRLQAKQLSKTMDVTLVARSALKDRFDTFQTVEVPTLGFVSLHRIGHVFREWWASRRLIAVALSQHRERQFDVAIFHTHTLAALGARKLRKLGARTVLVAHADIRKRPAGTYDPLLTLLYRWSNPRAYKRVDRVIALSGDYATLAREDAGNYQRVRVIPCPITGPWPAVPKTQSRALKPGSPVRIGFAGRLAIEKGLETLFRSINTMRMAGLDCRLSLAGAGPLRSTLDRLSRDLGLSEAVEFLGWLSEDRLASFYDSLDLFCLPSISENQGLVAQEALLHGVPVVATKVGALPEVVRPGLDGELCEPHSVEGLVGALRTAIHRLEKGGYRVPDPRWMERFSPAGHTRAVSDLIEELVT